MLIGRLLKRIKNIYVMICFISAYRLTSLTKIKRTLTLQIGPYITEMIRRICCGKRDLDGESNNRLDQKLSTTSVVKLISNSLLSLEMNGNGTSHDKSNGHMQQHEENSADGLNGNGASHDKSNGHVQQHEENSVDELNGNESTRDKSNGHVQQQEDNSMDGLNGLEDDFVLLSCTGSKKPKKKKKFNSADHPHNEKREPPSVRKNDDGTWGPTGLYGGRVKETPLLRALRDAIKPNRLERVEKVLQARCQRVQCLFENLCDPANGAACLRTMEGLGLLEANAVESYEPFRVQGGITINADKVSSRFSSFIFVYIFLFLFRRTD